MEHFEDPNTRLYESIGVDTTIRGGATVRVRVDMDA
jgi:hypothetical protein